MISERFNKGTLRVALAIVPTYGLKYKRVLVEFQILGTAAGVITASFNFGKKSRETDTNSE